MAEKKLLYLIYSYDDERAAALVKKLHEDSEWVNFNYVNPNDYARNTLLHLSAKMGLRKTCSALSKMGEVHLNERNNDGLTALEVAAESKQAATCMVLFKRLVEQFHLHRKGQPSQFRRMERAYKEGIDSFTERINNMLRLLFNCEYFIEKGFAKVAQMTNFDMLWKIRDKDLEERYQFLVDNKQYFSHIIDIVSIQHSLVRRECP